MQWPEKVFSSFCAGSLTSVLGSELFSVHLEPPAIDCFSPTTTVERKALDSINGALLEVKSKRGPSTNSQDREMILRGIFADTDGVDRANISTADSSKSKDLWSKDTLAMLDEFRLKVLIFRYLKGSNIRFCLIYDDPKHAAADAPLRVLVYRVFVSSHLSIKRIRDGASTEYAPKRRDVDVILAMRPPQHAGDAPHVDHPTVMKPTPRKRSRAPC
jgi:hypothetical protein